MAELPRWWECGGRGANRSQRNVLDISQRGSLCTPQQSSLKYVGFHSNISQEKLGGLCVLVCFEDTVDEWKKKVVHNYKPTESQHAENNITTAKTC